MASKIFEYRGVSDLVYAEVTKDDATYETGTVKELAGVAEIGRTTESSSETHYYDNQPAIVLTSTGADTVTISCSAIPLDVFAEITGQQFDSAKGVLIEGDRTPKYFAIGYKTKKHNGEEVYVWRYKGQFNVPASSHATENSGTDAKGQELTYTGIMTNHKFTSLSNKGAKAINVDVALGKANVATFFDKVTTPDDLETV